MILSKIEGFLYLYKKIGSENMNYKEVTKGHLLTRLNRFIAEVVIEGKVEQAHIKNTGRLTELLQKNTEVVLERAENPNRKTKYSLIAVNKNGKWVNVDSQAPNKIAHEALQKGALAEFGRVKLINREATYGNSRFDLYYETDDDEKGFIEVKGVTLEQNGIAMFPDAPTKRGAKHVSELIDAVRHGYAATILFIAQMEGCRQFASNWEMDRAFAEELAAAASQHVQILAYDTIVTETGVTINKPLPVLLDNLKV